MTMFSAIILFLRVYFKINNLANQKEKNMAYDEGLVERTRYPIFS